MSDDSRIASRRTDTRAKLVAAAASLIPEVGWENVSSRKVAERADVNPGVIHYHVTNIAELRRLAAIHTVRTFFEGPIRDALAEPDPQTGIANLFHTLSGNDPQDPELLLLYESLVAANRDEQLRAEIAATLAELRQLLGDWLAERDIARPVAAAVTITAAVDGYLLQRALDPSLGPDHLVDGLSQLVSQTR